MSACEDERRVLGRVCGASKRLPESGALKLPDQAEHAARTGRATERGRDALLALVEKLAQTRGIWKDWMRRSARGLSQLDELFFPAKTTRA